MPAPIMPAPPAPQPDCIVPPVLTSPMTQQQLQGAPFAPVPLTFLGPSGPIPSPK